MPILPCPVILSGGRGDHTICLTWTIDKDPRFELWRSPKWMNPFNYAWRRTMMVVAAVVQSTQLAEFSQRGAK
jgi:hypothetical protein